MKFKSRRFAGHVLELVGHQFAEIAEELQEWAEKITRQVEGGIPAGFNDVTPEPIAADAGGAGSEDQGWAAADHEHDGRHTLLDGRIHTDTGSAVPARGEVVVGTGAGAWSASSPPASDGQVLTADSSQLTGTAWKNPGNVNGTGGSPSQSVQDAELWALTESYALRHVKSLFFK